ncbi:MAG TPA: hypothetical protein G4N96_01240 [Chloroflexi bacterium]|nr:hypothetical protein [Chloroflexota bacterium]
MQKISKSVVLFIILAIIALLTCQWQAKLLTSAAAYHSPLTGEYPAPGESLPPQSERVVLVILSGLGDELQQQLHTPVLEQLIEAGASATSLSSPPSFRQPAWTSLISGAAPALNDAPPLFSFNGEVRTVAVDTIFHSAQRASVGTALLGNAFWSQIIPPKLVSRSVYAQFDDAPGDEQLMKRVAPLLEDDALQLFVLQFNQLAHAAQTSVGRIEDYQTAADQLDAHLSRLVNLLDLDKTTLIITADYGLIEGGGRGGHDAPVVGQPFVMTGKRVIPGRYNSIEQIDIAPTIAALLGLSFPSANQGRPLLEMLQIPDPAPAPISVSLAAQRITLTQHYLAALKMPAPTIGNIAKAEQLLADKNYAGAAKLAFFLVFQADEAAQQAQENRLSRERRIRFLILVAALIILQFYIARQRTKLWVDALLSGAVIVAAYHIIYRLEGLPYSLSAIVSLEQSWFAVALRVGASVLLGSLFFLTLLALRRYTHSAVILHAAYELFLFAAIGFILPALYGFWQFGLTVTWYFPDVALFFHYLTALWQTFWLAVMGLLTPALIVLLNKGIQKGLSAYQQRQLLKWQTSR